MNRTVAVGLLTIAACACATLAFAAGQVRDGAVIQNSGSTNFAGYTIKVWSDGAVHGTASGRSAAAQSGSSQTVSIDLVQRFFLDARAARQSGRTLAASCMKSASFGSTTVVHYHGWTSTDLECPGSGFSGALAADVNQIAQALQMKNVLTRTPRSRSLLMPGEPRRPPQSGSGQASAMPESTPRVP